MKGREEEVKAFEAFVSKIRKIAKEDGGTYFEDFLSDEVVEGIVENVRSDFPALVGIFVRQSVHTKTIREQNFQKESKIRQLQEEVDDLREHDARLLRERITSKLDEQEAARSAKEQATEVIEQTKGDLKELLRRLYGDDAVA
jgi:TPP-dependent pyruvate/acetoin dehydrogenase alpha subunit